MNANGLSSKKYATASCRSCKCPFQSNISSDTADESPLGYGNGARRGLAKQSGSIVSLFA